jgi:hypothetical protein
MNSIGKEYKQIGGNFKVVHHTEYLESLVAEGRLQVEASPAAVTYHDPCYLGRHNGVYDAPRNVLKVLTNDFVELDRNRENSFCCGAGGAQFWKEEEPGAEGISDNRFREAVGRLDGHGDDKVLAVGCPFCKSMLESTPGKSAGIAVKDVAELMLESFLRRAGDVTAAPQGSAATVAVVESPVEMVAEIEPEVVKPAAESVTAVEAPEVVAPAVARKKWAPKAASLVSVPEVPTVAPVQDVQAVVPAAAQVKETTETLPVRKKWEPKKSVKPPDSAV